MRLRYVVALAALFASQAVLSQSLVDKAVQHLEQNASAYGITAADLQDAVATDAYVARRTRLGHVYLRQRWQGIDVVEASYAVTLRPNGTVLHLAGSFVPNLAGHDLAPAPALTASAAAEALAHEVELIPTEPFTVLVQEGGPDQAATLSKGGVAQAPVSARLVYQWDDQLDQNELRLAWEIGLYTLDAQHSWLGYIDALTGDLLTLKDYVVSDTFGPSAEAEVRLAPIQTDAPTSAGAPYAASSLVGTYRVYPYPVVSPIYTAPLPPADARVLVANPDDPAASPFGWHDTNGVAGAEFTTTQGNNTHAYTDTDANNSPDPGSSPDGGGGLVFDFPLDLTLPPSAYRPAAVTNLFYWNNIIHDIFYQYGFDEVAGNFQQTNYGGVGVSGDYVRAEAQDGSGVNNANFCTPPEGGSTGCGSVPRMQMFLGSSPNPDVDGDLDNHVIVHEYTHGLSKRLTGGPANTSCLSNSEHMGEGWSDWYGLHLTQGLTDTRTTRRPVGNYLFGQPPGGTGIRPAPYTTDFAVNNFTYQRSRTQVPPHGVGFVWATILWEVSWDMMDAFGFDPNIWDPTGSEGNIVMLNLATEAMKMMPCSPGFVDARDAILAAETALYGDLHRNVLWIAFARRGLGLSASQGSPNTNSDNTEAFDIPPDVPVELVGFSALQDGADVLLRWNTASETNNAGFEVQARTGDGPFDALGFVEGHGTTTEARDYAYRATGLASGTYTFRLKQVDFDGVFEYSPEVEVAVGVVGTHTLSAVYPNPFNPQAQFSLAVSRTQQVTVGVYDVMGRQVAMLHDGALEGQQAYRFTVEGAGLASGAYFVRIAGETFAETRRIMLLK